jgi:hypothetical protein
VVTRVERAHGGPFPVDSTESSFQLGVAGSDEETAFISEGVNEGTG